MKDATTMDMLKAFTKKLDPQNLAYILHHQRGGLVCGRSGVWFCPEYKHLLHVCRGSVEGKQKKKSTKKENFSSSMAK